MAHERRPDLNSLTAVLAAAISGEPAAAREVSGLDPSAVVAAASHHAVTPLLADRLMPLGGEVSRRLQTAAHAQTAVDLARELELRQALAALDAAGVHALVIKGAHVAYQFYSRPDLRPRIDTDLLIRDDDRQAAARVLESLGYGRRDAIGGERLTSQEMFVKRDGESVRHAVDLHWRVANPQIFAGVLTFDELSRDAVPLPALGPGARGLSPPQALLLACVHRVAHHYDTDCLIWIYDIHLIASRLRADEWDAFASVVRERSVSAVCRRGLMMAREYFGTSWPPAVDDAWTGGVEAPSEPTAAYLAADRRLAAHLWLDLRAIPDWPGRWQLLREHLFPSSRYMRQVYASDSAAPLPVLYVRRVLHGARKWLLKF